MRRRDFIRTGAAVGGVVVVRGATGFGRLGAANRAAETTTEQAQRVGRALDPSDRSTSRDPLAIHASTLVVDGVHNMTLDDKLLGYLKAGATHCIVRPGASTIQGFANIYNFIDRHKNEFAAATTVREIEQSHQEGKIAFVFHSQNPGYLGERNGYSPPTPLRGYYQLGLRVLALSYNVAGVFGGGCVEPHIGLTKAGRRLVEEIHTLRIVLDVGGHVGEQTSFDAIAISKGVAVISSHTNVAALNDNPRNISDRLMEAIAKSGGVIGISAHSDFLARSRKDANVPRTPQAPLEKFLDHLDYVRKNIGADHVAIGSDHNLSPRIAATWDWVVMPADTYSDAGDKFPRVKGYESPDELPNVTRGLVQRGWSTEEIQKCLGGNWLRVFKLVWGA